MNTATYMLCMNVECGVIRYYERFWMKISMFKPPLGVGDEVLNKVGIDATGTAQFCTSYTAEKLVSQ